VVRDGEVFKGLLQVTGGRVQSMACLLTGLRPSLRRMRPDLDGTVGGEWLVRDNDAQVLKTRPYGDNDVNGGADQKHWANKARTYICVCGTGGVRFGRAEITAGRKPERIGGPHDSHDRDSSWHATRPLPDPETLEWYPRVRVRCWRPWS